MNYIEATLFFPLGTLIGKTLEAYQDPESGWRAAHWDDTEHTRIREASLEDGSVVPTPHYNEPIPEKMEEFTQEWRDAHLDGHTITCGWPEEFIKDINEKKLDAAKIAILLLLSPMSLVNEKSP
jgi:hypothetical protein